MKKHVGLLLSIITTTTVGCGGVTSQDGESSDAINRGTNNSVICQVTNPAYVSLDDFTATPRNTVGATSVMVIGEPLWLWGQATAHAQYPGSGPGTFPYPVVFDGATVQVPLDYAHGTYLGSPSFSLFGPTVTGATAALHTLSITSPCGTESRTLTLTKVAATAPTPSLSVSNTYVPPGTPVNLSGSSGFTYSSCAHAQARLVGKQDYDGKVVLDETYDPNGVFSWDKTVQPALTTTYTLTMSCTLATYASAQTATQKIKVYSGNQNVCGTTPQGTWVFCLSCPAGIAGSPPYETTWIESACYKSDAEQAVQNMGTNCEVSDDAC